MYFIQKMILLVCAIAMAGCCVWVVSVTADEMLGKLVAGLMIGSALVSYGTWYWVMLDAEKRLKDEN